MQEVEDMIAPSTVEDLIESKVKEWFQDLPSEMPLVQYTQVHGALVTKSATLVPNEDMEQLEDPLGMIFKRESFGMPWKRIYYFLWCMVLGILWKNCW